MINSRIANIAIPRTIATASMPATMKAHASRPRDDQGRRRNDFVTNHTTQSAGRSEALRFRDDQMAQPVGRDR
jgi:hypothetical protein